MTHLALPLGRVETRAGLNSFLERTVPPGEEPAAERVELVERNTELAKAREQLRLDLAMDRVVDPLVRRRLDVPIRPADADDLCDLPSVPGGSVT